jgi:DNA-binding GntR family transcriptional regulator
MPLSDAVDLQRLSTAEKLAGALREQILRGQIPAGASLGEEELARLGSVSRHTARAAIRVLVAGGLARHTAHKGATVASLTASDVRQLYQVRRLLEPAAVDVPAQLDADALAQLERVAARTNEDLVEADLAFHSALVALANNERVDRFYAQIVQELRLAFVIVAFADDEWRDSERLIAEHQALMELLRAGHREESKQALVEHIDQYEVRLATLIDGGATAPAP